MTTATYNARPGAAPGTVARARFVRMSATKARAVLDLIRGADVRMAEQTLRFCEREAAVVIGKLLHSAVANAEHNDDQIGDDLVVSACYADEGRTIRRFRPRARGRATRIRKRTCHITLVVSRMTEDQLERRRARDATRPGSRASRRAGQEAAEEKTGRTRRRRRAKAPQETGQTAPTPMQPAEPELVAAQPAEPEPAQPAAQDDALGIFQESDPSDTQAPEAAAPTSDEPPKADGEEAEAAGPTSEEPPKADSEEDDQHGA